MGRVDQRPVRPAGGVDLLRRAQDPRRAPRSARNRGGHSALPSSGPTGGHLHPRRRPRPRAFGHAPPRSTRTSLGRLQRDGLRLRAAPAVARAGTPVRPPTPPPHLPSHFLSPPPP